MTNTPHTSDSETVSGSETVSVSDGSSGDSVAAPTREQILAWFERSVGLSVAEDDDDSVMYRALLELIRSASQEPRAAVATVARDERMSPVEGVAIPRDIAQLAVQSLAFHLALDAHGKNRSPFAEERQRALDAIQAAQKAPAATAPPSPDTAPGLPAQAAKPPTCGGIAPPGATPITEADARTLDQAVGMMKQLGLKEMSGRVAELAARLSKGERGRGEAPLSRGDPA